MKQILTLSILIFAFCAYANYEEIEQVALPIDYEALNFNQDELMQALNNEMDFIEKKTEEVKLQLENSDEISVTSSAIKREPAIKESDQENLDDEELSTLFDAENPKKERRIRSR